MKLRPVYSRMNQTQRQQAVAIFAEIFRLATEPVEEAQESDGTIKS